MSNDESAKISKPFFYKRGEKLVLYGILFENGIFLSLSSESNLRIGTVALSLPFNFNNESNKKDLVSHTHRKGISTITVFGSRNEVYAKALAEKITVTTGKIIYLSINFKENDHELYSDALKLINEFLKEYIDYA